MASPVSAICVAAKSICVYSFVYFWIGTPRQIEEVSKLYRVYASTGLTDKEMETTEDYLVDHTIFFYLMGPDGLIRQYFGKQMTSTEVSDGILKVMDEELGGPVSWWSGWFGK